MYAEERQQAIGTMVSQRGRMSVAALSETFGVTTETVRRDLAFLERIGQIRRVHGGAVPTGIPPRDRTGHGGTRSDPRATEGPDRPLRGHLSPSYRRQRHLRRGHDHGPHDPRTSDRERLHGRDQFRADRRTTGIDELDFPDPARRTSTRGDASRGRRGRSCAC